MVHQIVNTSYGEVMVKPIVGTNDESTSMVLECYVGDKFDNYIGEIEGNVYDDAERLRNRIEDILF